METFYFISSYLVGFCIGIAAATAYWRRRFNNLSEGYQKLYNEVLRLRGKNND